MRSKIVTALGGFLVPSKRTRLLFCRDVFEYPELEGHELLCNHLGMCYLFLIIFYKDYKFLYGIFFVYIFLLW